MSPVDKIEMPEKNGKPIIRVGVFHNQTQVDFKVDGPFSIADGSDKVVFARNKPNIKWRLKLKERKPGKFAYRLVLLETHDENHVDEVIRKLKKRGWKPDKERVGGHVYINGKFVTENTRFLIIVDHYDDWFEAHREMRRYQPEFTPSVHKSITRQPFARFELFDADYNHAHEFTGPVRIVPDDSAAKTKLFDIYQQDVDQQKEIKGNYFLDGTVEFNTDDEAMIAVINELPFDQYVTRALASEVGEDMPVEYIKAMAIVARSEAIVRYGIRHHSDKYDFCSTPHCLRYFGENYTDSNIEKAEKATRNLVVYDDRNICDAYFHLISGGHTEDAAGIWQTEDDAFFKGTYDYTEIDPKYEDLRDEKIVRNWIADRPTVFCNLAGMTGIPDSLRSNKQYFRWHIEYSRQELEDIIWRKTGIKVGTLFDIIPISRGRSGRLVEVEILGSLRNMRIRGELNIRMTLALDYLYSSCFIVDKELAQDGTPLSFSFAGAGHGHGVGLCKTGSAVMALDGKNYREILAHYFAQGNIKSFAK
jgi:stage II sporulation protein D